MGSSPSTPPSAPAETPSQSSSSLPPLSPSSSSVSSPSSFPSFMVARSSDEDMEEETASSWFFASMTFALDTAPWLPSRLTRNWRAASTTSVKYSLGVATGCIYESKGACTKIVFKIT